MIGSRPNLVEIVGAINSPGVYQFIKGDSYKDYVKRAGGYATDASREGTFIIYPNGNSKKICSDEPGWSTELGNNIYDIGDKFLDVNKNGVWDKLKPISMFEFSQLGLLFIAIGIIYIMIIAYTCLSIIYIICIIYTQ